MAGHPLILPVLAAALGVNFAVERYRQGQARKRRTAELGSLAAELGWSFHPAKSPARRAPYSRFRTLPGPYHQTTYNTVRGLLRVGERRYRVEMGDFAAGEIRGLGRHHRRSMFHISYMVLQVPAPPAAGLVVRPEGAIDMLKAAIGLADINFESAEFSDRFHVSATDRRFAYDLIHPRMVELLLRSRDLPVIDIQRGACCLTRGSIPWSVVGFQDQLRFAVRFLSLWPQHLIAAHANGDAPRPDSPVGAGLRSPR